MAITTRLTSESRRMCSKHPDKPATALRRSIEQAKGPKYTITRPQCDECAKRKVRANESLRTL